MGGTDVSEVIQNMPVAKAKDKIAKLLALAGSHNDHEAKAALLAARRLMARYKLTERDVAQEKEKLKEVESHYSFTGIRNAWMPHLANVIGKHHCCGVCMSGLKGRQTQNALFVGLDDDPVIANIVFTYACDHILDWGKDIRRRVDPGRIAGELVKEYILEYGLGFSEGLDAKYEEQNRGGDPGMALMVIVPQKVSDFMSDIKPRKLRGVCRERHPFAHQLGYRDGLNFDPTLRIEQ